LQLAIVNKYEHMCHPAKIFLGIDISILFFILTALVV